MKRAELPMLDTIRGIAAICVAFLYHFRYLTGDATLREPQLGRLSVPILTDWVYASGDVLVDLFFVLSGYLFCHVYRPGREPLSVRPWNFFIFRFSRLYPLHFVTLVCAGLLISTALTLGQTPYGNFLATPHELFLHLLLLKSGVVRGSFNAPAWSISVECACYVLFYAFARQRDRLFLVLTAGTCLAGVGLTQNWHPIALGQWWVARGFVGFFAGCLAFRVAPLIRKVPTAALLLMALTGFALSIRNWPMLHHISFFTRSSLLCWVPLMIAATRPEAQRWGETRFSKFIGDHSFSIYLWHVPVAMLVLLANAGQPYPREQWGMALIIHVLVTLAVATVSFRYLERPAQSALRKHLIVTQPSPPPLRS